MQTPNAEVKKRLVAWVLEARALANEVEPGPKTRADVMAIMIAYRASKAFATISAEEAKAIADLL